MAVKAEKLELVGITSLHNGVASNGVESKLADNGTHNASNGAWNRRRSTTEEGVQASMSPLLEEIHSDLMLRHILASSEDGETGGSFHYVLSWTGASGRWARSRQQMEQRPRALGRPAMKTEERGWCTTPLRLMMG
jgi:hypothetical protein